jgi:hypothetical protein
MNDKAWMYCKGFTGKSNGKLFMNVGGLDGHLIID